MGGLWGADVAALRELAGQLATGAGALRTTQQQVSSLVESAVRWEGPDAAQFRSDWSATLAPAVANASTLLEHASDALRRNADEQESTSSTGGGPGGPGSPGGSSGPGGGTPGTPTPGEYAEMSASERADWLARASDAQIAALYAQMVQDGVDPESPGFGDLASAHWTRVAAAEAGFDVADWDPSAGSAANREIIEGVYTYYGELYLDHPWMQWAGMAAMIGPSFAAGFFDLDMMRELAQGVGDAAEHLPPGVTPDALEAVAGMTDAELGFYENQFLSMQREIFVDQAGMHEAYLSGGLPEMERMLEAGVIDDAAYQAWADIDAGRAGDAQALADGNTALLSREQNQIIADDWQTMRDHAGTGEAFTYLMTLVGEPSIPGAGTYAQYDPFTVNVETPGPQDVGIPFTGISFDNPLQGSVSVETPLPGGNIADQGARWDYITRDTLPAYQQLITEHPDQAAQIIGSDVSDRIDGYRLTDPGRIGRIVDRLGEWNVDVDQ
ncbi:WXG100 family type VII secretion target [Cellulosimicrobium arenosum]|uniref:WXG100 family type VII secretion target n=1 Tax=Cellulosimicrobium arenosum TaxID=2708133 RepID=A0A927PCX1_9MICO|nr:WXG100 family type VII secretion target [Cellulosimicrobium arenosum]MBD8079593.1 WXG100 family type VII secretion target [Cellulosimicrobium arenosum]